MSYYRPRGNESTLTDAERDALAGMVERMGITRVARRMGVSRLTLANMVAGIGVRLPYVTHVRVQMTSESRPAA